MFHCEEKFLKARSWQIMQDWQIPSMIRTTNAGHILPPRRQVSYQWFRNLLYVFQDGLEAPTLPNWRFYFRNYILRQMKQQLHLGKANTSECRVYYIAGFLSWCHLRIFVERERERERALNEPMMQIQNTQEKTLFFDFKFQELCACFLWLDSSYSLPTYSKIVPGNVLKLAVLGQDNR